MRTTLTLDDDAAALAQNFARANSLRLGQAVSELIRCARIELLRWFTRRPAARCAVACPNRNV